VQPESEGDARLHFRRLHLSPASIGLLRRDGTGPKIRRPAWRRNRAGASAADHPDFAMAADRAIAEAGQGWSGLKASRNPSNRRRFDHIFQYCRA
jgi:hypothetical protein